MSGTFTLSPEAHLGPRRINTVGGRYLSDGGREGNGLLRGADAHDRGAAHGTLPLHRGLPVGQLHREGSADFPLCAALHAVTLHHGGITAGALGTP